MEQLALTHLCHPALKTAHILLAKPSHMTKPACQWGLKVYSSHKKESLLNHMTVGRLYNPLYKEDREYWLQ